MEILAINSESRSLEWLVKSIQEAMPQAKIYPFQDLKDAIAAAEVGHCDVAFLDIRQSGHILEGKLTEQLKQSAPGIHIIYTTGNFGNGGGGT